MPCPITDEARRVVIIGPGKIGCGYLAPLFAQAGWQVVLAARSPEVVGRIAAAGDFDVRTTGEAAPRRVHAEARPHRQRGVRSRRGRRRPGDDRRRDGWPA